MFSEIDIKKLEDKVRVFTMFRDDWALITAGDEKKINTMTAAWGGLGILWHRPVATVYVRPSRYTLGFIDAQDAFTVSFYKQSYRKERSMLGAKSGRDCDKIKEAGFTPVFLDHAPAFKEAELVLVCRKLYRQQMELTLALDPEIEKKCYPAGDVHIMFIGEIQKAYIKE